MPKFRKKPVVIEAVEYDGTDEGYARVCAFAPGVHFEPAGFGRIVVPTLEGDHYASPGDMIIRGVKGELYPCKPDIFAATYEPVDDSAARTPERGAVSGVHVLAFIVGLFMLAYGLMPACGPTKDAVRQVGEDVVNCTTTAAAAHTAEYGARIEKAIREHTANGETDWSMVGAEVAAIARELGIEVAGCVALATFERLLGVPTLAGPDLRAGWERVRLDALGGRRFTQEVGR